MSAKLFHTCVKCLGRSSLASARSLLRVTVTNGEHQIRTNTKIMERVFPLPQGKDGGWPHHSQCNELHKILRDVEVVEYPEDMQCILTDFVEGIGIRGDIVTVKRDFFHGELHPALLAVYASPENIAEFEQERKDKGIEKAEARLGVFARMTMKELNHLELQIPMNDQQKWTLTRQNVQVALRLQGIEVEEDCIVLPEEPVTDFGELSLQVWINSLEYVSMTARIVSVSEEFAKTRK